jgi:hypothetical protein
MGGGGGIQEHIRNFGDEISWQTATLKTKEGMGK